MKAHPVDVRSRLSEPEVAALVQRAVEIDALRGGSGDLDIAAVRQIVADVGVSDAAFSQALSEWQAGVLAAPRAGLGVDRQRAAGALACAERLVALNPLATAARLDAVLRRQCLDRIRRAGAESEYVRRRGLMADLQRGLDFRGQIRLKDVARLTATIQPSGEVCSRVRISVDLRAYRLGMLTGAISAPLAAGSVVALGSIPLSEWLLLGLPVGAVLSAGGWAGARLAVQARRAKVEDALAAVLDGLA